VRRLLLDTNVVVWLLLGDRRAVSDTAKRALSDTGNTIALSAVSVWEIAIKRSTGKLRIDLGWAKELTRLDFEPLPVISTHAEAVEHLPWHHRDPFDRLLIAQSAAEGMALVSADARFTAYGVDVVW
jgi:PIN domain nuclease of toxin-antitoxin system